MNNDFFGIHQKIIEFIDFKNVSQAEFVRICDLKSSTFNQAIKKEKDFGVSQLLKIIHNYPDFVDFFINKNVSPNIHRENVLNEPRAVYKRENENLKDKIISMLEADNARLSHEVKSLKKERQIKEAHPTPP